MDDAAVIWNATADKSWRGIREALSTVDLDAERREEVADWADEMERASAPIPGSLYDFYFLLQGRLFRSLRWRTDY